MYHVGELVVYRGEGVCRVEAVGPLNMSGAQKNRLYYTLTPLRWKGKIYTPVDACAIIRPALTKKEAMALIRTISSGQTIPRTGQSSRILSKFDLEKLYSYNGVSMPQIVKTIYGKHNNRRSQNFKPNDVDKRCMKQAEEMLCSELAVALEIPRENVVGYITQMIENVR